MSTRLCYYRKKTKNYIVEKKFVCGNSDAYVILNSPCNITAFDINCEILIETDNKTLISKIEKYENQ